MPVTEKPRGENYTAPTGARTIKGVLNALEECKTVGGLPAVDDLADRFTRRRHGLRRHGPRRWASYTRYEWGVIDRLDKALRVLEVDAPPPDTPIDEAFWRRAEELRRQDDEDWNRRHGKPSA